MRKAIGIFIMTAAVVLAALLLLTAIAHRGWIAGMTDIAGEEALALRGYTLSTGPLADPTFAPFMAVMRPVTVILPLAAGLGAAGFYLFCLSRIRQSALRTAGSIDSLLRGGSPAADPGVLGEKLGQLEILLKQKEAESARENEAVKALINDISHQLKTPIASLRLNLDLLEEGGLSGEERENFLRQAVRQTERIDALAAALVKAARLESGAIAISPEIADIVETVRLAIGGRAVRQCLPEGPLFLPHDIGWTREAIGNVLDNALKYGNGEVRLRMETGDSYTRIDIEDNGDGLDNAEIAKLFSRFYRGAAASATKAEGSGLGLHIAREIMRRQGGAITAENLPQGGARFTLFLQNR